MKHCPGCTRDLDASCFGWRKKRGERVRRSRCKECDSDATRAHAKAHPERVNAAKRKWEKANPEKYALNCLRAAARRIGVDPEPVIERFAQTGGRCEICGRTPAEAGSTRYKRLSIDHCHETGRFRGLLCAPCNSVLGLAGDDRERLESAVSYLAKHSGSS